MFLQRCAWLVGTPASHYCWVTFDADPSPDIRAKLQVVACKQGLHIMSHLQCHDRFD